MKFVHQIPNMITLGNLFLGCLAIVYLFYDHMVIEVVRRGEVQAEMGLINISCFLVFVAAFVDFFDGFVARALRAESPIGGELDSLSDMVCFGLVPGLIMYQLLAKSYYTAYDSFQLPILLFSAGFLITLFAAIRLARFNLDDSHSGGFTGVPTPSIAMFVASLPLIQLSDQTGMGAILNDKWVLLGITAVLCYLMVAPLPMLSLKIKKLDWSVYKWQIGGILSGLAIFLICIFAGLKYLAVPISFTYYLVLSIVHNITTNGVQGSN